MQNIREWREGSITKATVVYEIPIVYSYGSDLHPIRNQLLWQTTKKGPFWSIMHGKQTNHLFYGLFWRIFNGKCVLPATLQYDTFATKRRVKMKQSWTRQLFKPWQTKIGFGFGFWCLTKINLKFYHNLQFQTLCFLLNKLVNHMLK